VRLRDRPASAPPPTIPEQSARTRPVVHIVARRNVMTLEEAIARVGRLLGATLDWASLESFLPDDLKRKTQ